MKRIFNKIKNNKMLLFLSVLILGLAIVLIARFTYAYLLAQYGSAVKKDVVLKTDTTDNFKISIGDPLSISATSTTLPKGGSNIVKTSKSTVSLLANSTTKSVSKQYYVYFQIPSNSFVYSDGTTPEIVLSITGPSGEVTSISGLTYGTYSGVNGFDVTTKTGSFAIASAQAISSSSSTSATTENWTFTLTYLNLASVDQSTNYGHTMSTKIIVSKEERVTTLADYCASGDKLASCIMTFAKSVGSSASNIYIHDSSLTNGAGDNSYRYSGPSSKVNNYVCFGTNTTPCPTDNLYRIIGVFGDKVKLIKYDYANSNLLGTDGDYNNTLGIPNASYYKGSLTRVNTYYWNYEATNSATNTWSTSLLNKTNLNTNFITNIGTEWTNKIATTTWKVGGNAGANIYDVVPATAYQNEIVNPVTTEYPAKIGLMYASDFGFAADPSAWTTTLWDYSGSVNGSTIKSLNWMYMGYYEWTISRNSSDANNVFIVDEDGYVRYSSASRAFAVRPSFNLVDSTTYVSGTGTKANPYRIN